MSIHKFSNIAKNMAPGTFAILNNGSDASGYSTTFTSSGITTFNSYAYKATYDPLWQRVYILGDGGHMDPLDTGKFVCYELNKDVWSLLPYPLNTINGNRHIYGLQCHVSKPGSNIFFRIPGNQNNVFTWETDHADPQTTVYQGQVYPPPGSTAADAGGRGSIEYFPERDELIYHHSQAGFILKKPYSGGSWTNLVAQGTSEGNAIKHDGVGMLYHPVGKCIVWGSGADFSGGTPSYLINSRWWRYDATGSPIELDPFIPESFGAVPVDGTGLTGWCAFGLDRGSVLAADPGSRKYIVIRSEAANSAVVTIFQLDPFAASGSQWSRLSALESFWPITSAYGANHGGAGEMTAIAILEYNVILFSAYNKTFLYKHSSALTFTDKRTLDGVLSSFPFTSQSELKNTWQSAGSAAVAPLEAYLATKGTGIGYTFPWPYSNDRLPGEGNNSCGLQPITQDLAVPEIDGTDGLRFTLPSKMFEAVGNYNANFDDVLHSTVAAEVAINPTSPHGRVFYIQSKVKADAAFWGAQYRRADQFDVNENVAAYPGLFGVSCLAGSNVLAVPASAGYSVFTSAYVGKQVAILYGSGGPWVAGFYMITAFIDAQHVQLNGVPCPTGPGQYGAIKIEGTIDHGGGAPLLLQGGVKLYIVTGNPPYYGSPSLVATIKQRGEGANVFHNGPHFVQGSTGGGPTGVNFNDKLYWNETDWNELTFRIEVGGSDVTAGWRVTWWLNGVKYDPETDWYDSPTATGPTGYWATGPPQTGFGWFQISIQMTGHDPNQVTPVAHVWVKDVIISTQPIPMGANIGAAAVDLPAAPALPWFMRS